MHEVLVNRLGGQRLPRKSVVRLTDRPDMTLDVYHGRKTTIQYSSAPYLPFSDLSLIVARLLLCKASVMVYFLTINIWHFVRYFKMVVVLGSFAQKALSCC